MDRKKLTAYVLIFLVVISLSVGSVAAYMFREKHENKPIEQPKTECNATIEDGTVTITVTDDSNIDCYVRVRFVTYWVNSENQRVDEASAELVFVYDETRWLKDGDTYYYRQPISPKGNALTLCENLAPKTSGNYRQVIEAVAETIQAKPTDAVKDAWKVELDESNAVIAKK